MTTDRELLELAAKAVGHTLVWGEDYVVDGENIDCTDLPYVRSNQQDEADWYWNPLEDDGDALRLAVKIGMRIDLPKYKGFGTSAETFGRASGCTVFLDDPFEQTRRAIVLAAAEVGKAMP